MTKLYFMTSLKLWRENANAINRLVLQRGEEDLHIDKGTASHVLHFISNAVVNPRVWAMNERHRHGTLNVPNALHHGPLGPAEVFVQRLECHFTAEQSRLYRHTSLYVGKQRHQYSGQSDNNLTAHKWVIGLRQLTNGALKIITASHC